MKEIPLTQGQVALVDDDDFEWLMQWKWHAVKWGNVFYAIRMLPSGSKRERISMHQALIGKKKNRVCDHINGIGTDNRRENLRHVTPRQNAQNKHVVSSSRFPGVAWHKATNKWESRVKINGKLLHLGLFTDEEKAFQAYCKALRKTREQVLPELREAQICFT